MNIGDGMHDKINKWLWITCCILFVGLMSYSIYTTYIKKQLSSYDTRFFYMDTYIYVNLYETEKEKAETALKEVEKIYKRYHELTDRYQSYPSINNLYFIHHNQSEEEWISLDKELYDLIEISLSYREKSDGLFDIRLGDLTDVWKKAIEEEKLPNEEELSSTKEYKDILLEDGKIYNNHANIDLGAVTKGYATKKAGEYLEKMGINCFIINAGGNVLVGNHYGDDAYKIGIEDPTKKEGEIFIKVKANNKAVVTSGGYQRFFEIDKQRYNHIINPLTLYPSNHTLSVTVITEDSFKADILSTILFLMDIDTGLAFVEQLKDVEAIWYVSREEQIMSTGFKQYLYE